MVTEFRKGELLEYVGPVKSWRGVRGTFDRVNTDCGGFAASYVRLVTKPPNSYQVGDDCSLLDKDLRPVPAPPETIHGFAVGEKVRCRENDRTPGVVVPVADFIAAHGAYSGSVDGVTYRTDRGDIYGVAPERLIRLDVSPAPPKEAVQDDIVNVAKKILAEKRPPSAPALPRQLVGFIADLGALAQAHEFCKAVGRSLDAGEVEALRDLLVVRRRNAQLNEYATCLRCTTEIGRFGVRGWEDFKHAFGCDAAPLLGHARMSWR